MKTVGTSLHSLGTDPAPSGKLLRLLFLFLLINFAWFYHAGGDNENAHFDQIRALAEEGRWSIDRLAGDTADVIMVHGHIFPNKAPGMTFLCVVPWKICRALVAIGPLSEAVRVHLISYFVQLSTLGLFSALTGCALYVFLCRIGLSSVVALLLALLYSLGTIAFPFSTIFFSHQLAASFLFLGFFLLWRERQHDTRLNPGEWRRQAEIVLAGVLLGFAPVLEYPAALGTVIIGLYGLTSLDWRRFVLFALAGTAAASSLFLYNWSAFHQLFFISYAAYNAPGSAFRGHRLGFAGVTWPRLSVLWQITFGRQRGLFYINPWLCLILPALRKDHDKQIRPRYLDISLADAVRLRAATIHSAFEAFDPDVLIVDKLPRGAAQELDPTLEHLKRKGRTRCVLGLRDVLDEPGAVECDWSAAGDAEAIRDYYDDIWVYGDPNIYDAAREYQFPADIAAKVTYTGYLDQRPRLKFADVGSDPLPGLKLPPGRLALCLVGGGQDGEALAEAFVRAKLPEGFNGVLITGPFMPAEACTSHWYV